MQPDLIVDRFKRSQCAQTAACRLLTASSLRVEELLSQQQLFGLVDPPSGHPTAPDALNLMTASSLGQKADFTA